MKKILSLTLAFTVSSLGLISTLAQPLRAQQVASAGKSISEIKEEYERLLAVDRDPSTPSEVRKLNQQFLEKRRGQLSKAIESRLGALRKYQSSMGTSLSGEEGIVVGNSISALERELSALTGEQNTITAPSSVPRARLIGATPNASPRLAPRALSEPSKDAQPAQAIQASYTDEVKTNRESETRADTSAPKKAPALEVTSPDRDRTVHVSEVEMEVGVYDDDIDDIMVAVYTAASEKPKSARILNIKRSDKGVKSVVVSLTKGDNRIEVSDLKRSEIKAVRNITFTSPEAPGIGSTVAGNFSEDAASQADKDKKTAAANEMKVAVIENQSKEYDWGRIRGYFTGGVVFSKEREDFSKSDIVLSFVLDKNYIRNLRWNFNTFFEARLAAVPVAAQSTDSTSASPTPTPTATPNSIDTFIASRKAALAQAGIYVPINVSHWRHDRRLNTLFIGPVAKGGIQTITGNTQTAEAQLLGADDVYNFFSVGVRLGHYSYPRPVNPCKQGEYPQKYKDVSNKLETTNAWDYDNKRDCDEQWDYAPELVSWLDITRGRWENFENNIMVNGVTVRRRPWRYQAEGRLKIPGGPFLVGFDGNFGEGKDDVRFGFGMRFDVGKLIQKLKAIEAFKALDEAQQDAANKARQGTGATNN